MKLESDIPYIALWIVMDYSSEIRGLCLMKLSSKMLKKFILILLNCGCPSLHCYKSTLKHLTNIEDVKYARQLGTSSINL